MSSRYVFSIAGCNRLCAPVEVEFDGEIVTQATNNELPTVINVTFVPEISWPVWHAAFERDTLAGLWWYTPARIAVPVIEAAIERMQDPNLAPFVHPQDFRRLAGNRAVLKRLLVALNLYPDNVIAVGVEEEPPRAWVDELPPSP
jgi:hypothetical protein